MATHLLGSLGAALFWLWLWAALKAGLLLLAALLATRLVRGHAAQRHLVWTAAFCAALALPFLGLLVPSVRVQVVPAAVRDAAERTATGLRAVQATHLRTNSAHDADQAARDDAQAARDDAQALRDGALAHHRSFGARVERARDGVSAGLRAALANLPGPGWPLFGALVSDSFGRPGEAGSGSGDCRESA